MGSNPISGTKQSTNKGIYMWILIIYIYAGMLASGDSVALLQVQDSIYKTKQECTQQKKELENLVSGSAKELKIACIQRGTY